MRVVPHVRPSLIVDRARILTVGYHTSELVIVWLMQILVRILLRGEQTRFGALRIELEGHLLLALHLLCFVDCLLEGHEVL